MKQKTVNNSVEFQGICTHSGLITKVKLLPSEKDGIFFKRNDNLIEAKYNNVTETQLGTVISDNNMKVAIIEHLMAAIYACNIDNLLIEIDNIEVPILDGSSKEFIEKIKQCGIKELNSNRKFLKIKKIITYQENDKFITLNPSDDFVINMTTDFNYGKIGKQTFIWNNDKNHELFNARTFCNVKDVDYMRSIGLAKGGSLDNAMVFNENGLINEKGFRFDLEVVKHKILDCIGDLYTSGYHLLAKVDSYKTGHSVNNKLLYKLFEDKNNYEIIEL